MDTHTANFRFNPMHGLETHIIRHGTLVATLSGLFNLTKCMLHASCLNGAAVFFMAPW